MNLSGFVHAQRASFLSFSLWEVEVVDKNIVRSGSLSSLQHAQQAFVSAARILWWIKAHLPLLWSVKGTWRLADWTYNGRYLLFHDSQKKSLWEFCPHFTQMPLQTSSHQTHLKVHLLACSDPFTWSTWSSSENEVRSVMKHVMVESSRRKWTLCWGCFVKLFFNLLFIFFHLDLQK